MAPTCRGNIFGRIGTSFGVSFLQTGDSLKKARGSERERVTSVCENDIRTLSSPALVFLHRLIRPNRSIMLNFGIIQGSSGLFYTLFEFMRI